jgi:phosphate transport system substrate-binding protein
MPKPMPGLHQDSRGDPILNVHLSIQRASVTVAVGALLVMAACSGPSGGGNVSDGGAGGAEGEIFVSGSSTVEPITNRVAEEFAATNAEFAYTVEGPGTGDGFAIFCNGETDISDASRAISEEEAAACADSGVEYVELLVGYDGLSVITGAGNADVSCLSFLDLYALLGPESEGFDSWSDANDLAATLADELGTDFGESHAPYPAAPLTVTAPGEESGTFDSFVELALGDIAEARGQEETTRPDYTGSPNDNVIISGVTDSSLGWVGLAFAHGAAGVKSIEIDGGDGCVAPEHDTVADGSYPISRPLFIYPSLQAVDDNPAVAPFVDYYVSEEGLALAGEVGYVALTEEQGAATRSAWEGR